MVVELTQRCYKVDLGGPEVYESGAALVTLLARPESGNSDRELGALHASLCARVLQARASEDEGWAGAPQLVKPLYAFRPEKVVARDLRTLGRRLRDRMVAARMGLSFLKQSVEGERFVFPSGLSGLSIHEVAAWVADDAGQADFKNVESRVWRPSVPVLHLACAVAMAVDQSERLALATGRPEGVIQMGQLLTQREVIEWVVRTASEVADLLSHCPGARVRREQLIEIVLS